MPDGPPPKESLRRELLAVLVLYAFLAVIPLVMGLCCGRPAP
jgi:hypothetical protein